MTPEQLATLPAGTRIIIDEAREDSSATSDDYLGSNTVIADGHGGFHGRNGAVRARDILAGHPQAEDQTGFDFLSMEELNGLPEGSVVELIVSGNVPFSIGDGRWRDEDSGYTLWTKDLYWMGVRLVSVAETDCGCGWNEQCACQSDFGDDGCGCVCFRCRLPGDICECCDR